MAEANQQPVIEFLSHPSAWPDVPAGATVERIETHSAIVFLVGPRAYKLKRAVRYDYLDFSTVERRERFCRAEVALNQRTAPDLYRGVVAVTRERDGRLAVAGQGVAVDFLVEMERFAGEQLLDRVAARGELDPALMPPLARAIAALHATAAVRHDRTGVGVMRWVVGGNAAGFANEGRLILDAAQATRVVTASQLAIARHASLLDARAAAGCIRECHGDLHLRNIVLRDGRPVLFDAVEFNDDISCIDVLYDVAFLLMDLWRLGLHRQANALFNAYVMATFAPDTCGALALLPLFLSCRSAVRAKTGATSSRLQTDPQQGAALADTARSYLAAAETFLRPPPPALVAIGGLSGSGKTTMAKAIGAHLGAPPGAVVLRSDVLRKRMAGVPETDRLGPDGYTPAMHARVYAALGEWAESALRGGHSVIVDAVFGSEDERRAITDLAARLGVPHTTLWLEAPLEVLTARVDARRDDASDATAPIVARQVSQGLDASVTWPRIPAHEPIAHVEARVREALTPHLRVL